MALFSDQDRFFYGMDDAGHVVIRDGNCGIFDCYRTYLNGVSTGAPSTAAPVFSWDNGTACTPAVPAGGFVIHGVCNNGRYAFTGFLASGQHFPGVYSGSVADLSFVWSQGEGLIYMNGMGDIVFDDHFSDTWYVALRDPSAVPEPSTMLLLGTGIIACVGAVRRRFSA